MLEKIREKDHIVDYLLEKSIFTKPQLDTMLISVLEDNELKLNRKVLLRDGKRVSKGSFIRTLRQGQKRLEKSLYTIIISEYLSIFDKNNLLNIIRVGELLKELQTQRINDKELQTALDQVTMAISNICRKS